MSIWIGIILRLAFCILLLFFFSFFHGFQLLGNKFYYLFIVYTLFMHCSWDLQPLYSEKNIKNRTHNTIHTFKNYFITIFLVFNKINCVQMDSKCNIFVPLNLHESIKCNSNPFLIFYLFKDCFMTHSANF